MTIADMLLLDAEWWVSSSEYELTMDGVNLNTVYDVCDEWSLPMEHWALADYDARSWYELLIREAIV